MVQHHEIAAYIFLNFRRNGRESKISWRKKWLTRWAWWRTEVKVCIISLGWSLEFRSRWWDQGGSTLRVQGKAALIKLYFRGATGIKTCILEYYLVIQNKDEILICNNFLLNKDHYIEWNKAEIHCIHCISKTRGKASDCFHQKDVISICGDKHDYFDIRQCVSNTIVLP